MINVPASLAALRYDQRAFPDYKVYAFKPYNDNYTKIITNYSNCTPHDITDYCSEIAWSPVQAEFTFKDPTGDFNPDTGMYADYLADGCIIRIKEGDSRVSEANWIWTFTGAIRGQLGWTANRSSKTMEAKVVIYSRENTLAWKKRMITSKNYTQGTDLGVMLRDVCSSMGMASGEFRLPYSLGRSFYFNKNQISQQAPWTALTSILEVVMGVPYFDGEGKLNYWKKNMNRSPDLILNNDDLILDYEVVARSDDTINKVQVTFLDSNLTEVGSTVQKIGTAQVTTGFFTPKEVLECWWSDDRKQRAKNTFMKVIKSINANLLPIGSEDYEQVDLYHGEITVTVGIWVPILATVMLLEYVGSAFIPDAVQVVIPVGTGYTISIGKVLQAQALVVIMYLMMCLGSCQYEIWGTPYDLAYIEKRSIAIVNGTEYYNENEMSIKNDFIGTQDWSDTIAITELTYQQSKSCPRKIVIKNILGLEIGDIIQLSDGRKIFISDMKKTIKRGSQSTVEITGFKVLTY
jgi:hypothetical protein